METKLSNNAIKDLREVLAKSFGKDVEISYSDEEVNEIGDLLLNILAEGLKMRGRIIAPELYTPKCK